MGKYGTGAVDAVELILAGGNPPNVWDKLFPNSKTCPRGAFLGLCEEGLVEGIKKEPDEPWAKGNPNKHYAIEAVRKLCEDPTYLKRSKKKFWTDIRETWWAKNENKQLDVVISLWKADKIKR